MLGKGLLIAEGADHRRQRRVLNPAFSPAAVKEMIPIFYDKATELKEKLQMIIEDDSIEASPTPATEIDKVQGGKKMDVSKWIAQATLDVYASSTESDFRIGIAGFGYDFKALSSEKNELSEAFRKMFSAGGALSFMAIFQALVPGARFIVVVSVFAEE
jgi:cytochrome P450